MLENCSVIAFIFWWLNPGRQKSGRHHFRSLSCHKQGAVTRVNYLIILRGLPAMSPFCHLAILPFQHFGWLMGQHLQHLLCCLLLPPPLHFRFRRLAKICPPPIDGLSNGQGCRLVWPTERCFVYIQSMAGRKAGSKDSLREQRLSLASNLNNFLKKCKICIWNLQSRMLKTGWQEFFHTFAAPAALTQAHSGSRKFVLLLILVLRSCRQRKNVQQSAFKLFLARKHKSFDQILPQSYWNYFSK